jgi:hypothetical protein
MSITVTPGWSDVTPYTKTRTIRTKRGKQHELGRVEAGSASLTLTSRDERFNPENTASPYYGGIQPRTPIRISVEYYGETVPLWRGFVKSWPQQWVASGKVSRVPIKCVDLLGVVARASVRDYQTDVLDDQPVAFWRATYPGFGDDSSGNDNSITWNLAPGGGGGAWTGSAIDYYDDFATHTLSTQWGTASDAAALRLTGDRSIEAWIELDPSPSSSSLRYLVSNGGGGGQELYSLGFAVNGTAVTLVVGFNNYAASLNATGVIPIDEWVHVAVVWHESGKREEIYVNGDLWSSEPRTFAADAVAGSQSTYIGQFWSGAGTTHFDGNWSEIAIFDRALSAGRVQSHYVNSQQPFTRQPQLTIPTMMTNVGFDSSGYDAPSWCDVEDLVTETNVFDYMKPYASVDSTVLEQLRMFEAAFETLLYVQGDGKLGVASRETKSKRYRTSVATYSDQGGLGYRGLTMPQDDSRIRNIWQVTPDHGAGSTQTAFTPGATAEVRDAESLAQYGPLTQTLSGAPYYEDPAKAGHPAWFQEYGSDDIAEKRARSGIAKTRESKTRIDRITIAPGGDSAQWAALFDLEIGRRITVVREPPGGSVDTRQLTIQRIAHQVQIDRTWLTTLQLSPAEDDDQWLLDTSTLGVDTELGW